MNLIFQNQIKKNSRFIAIIRSSIIPWKNLEKCLGILKKKSRFSTLQTRIQTYAIFSLNLYLKKNLTK